MQTGVGKHMQTAFEKKRGVQHVLQEPCWKQGIQVLRTGMLRTLQKIIPYEQENGQET